MSRTNKDKPLYARATWWEPEHWGCQYGTHYRWRTAPRRECDLPPEPDVATYDKTGFGPASNWGCTWEPVSQLQDRACRRAVPKWYVDHVGNNPNRRREREHNRRAIAEHRATGTVDAILPPNQHRHRAQWLWW